MTSLAWFLLLSVFVSIALFTLINFLTPNARKTDSKLPFIAYGWVMFIILGLAIWHFIGFDKSGTPRVPVEKLRRIQHTGFYVAPGENEISFSGKAHQNQAFPHKAFKEDEMLTFKPLWSTGHNKDGSWEIRYNAYSYPLRVDGQCMNLQDNAWLNPNDTFYVYLNNGKFFSIKWESEQSLWGNINNRYFFGEGKYQGSSRTYTKENVLLSQIVLLEGRSLSDMVRSAANSFKNAFPQIDRDEWDVFTGIKFIREKKNQAASRLGVLIAKNLFLQGVKFYRNDIELSFGEGERKDLIPSNVKVSYGLGHQNTFSVSLPDSLTEDPLKQNIIEIPFDDPISWPLPKSLADKRSDIFLITSSNDFIRMDGYYLEAGEAISPFYAKVTLNPTRDQMTVNDGTPVQSFGLDDTLRLGDYQRGLLVKLATQKSYYSFTGLRAMGLLLIVTLLLTLTIRHKKQDYNTLDLAWVLMWGMTLTLLIVRLIVTYRASLFPPDDAMPRQLENVFNKGFKYSFWALLIIPLILCVARLIATPKIFNRVSKLRIVKGLKVHSPGLVAWILTFVWIFAGKLFGANESLGILRINHVAYLLLIISLIFSAKMITQHPQTKEKMVTLAGIVLTICCVIFLIGDTGFTIYIISLSIFALSILLWKPSGTRPHNWKGILYSTSMMVVIVAALFLIPQLLTLPILQKMNNPIFPDSVFYRLVSYTGTESELLLARSEERDVNMSTFLNNNHQNWQMMLYAAKGLTEPSGYTQTRLSKLGMTYPTSMTDCAFSIYLLSEHGKWAGFFLIAVYLALCAICFYGSWRLPSSREYCGLILICIGSFFAGNALYMAAANIGLVPFTGQNIPFLGLSSGSDLLQIMTLLVIVTAILSNPSNDSDSFRKARRPIFLAQVSFLVGLSVFALCILFKMSWIQGEPTYTNDFNFKPEIFKELRHSLPDPNAPDKQTDIRFNGDRLITLPKADISEAVEQFVNQFNERTNKFEENGGVIFLKTVGSRAAQRLVVEVNENHSKMASPFRDVAMWDGFLTGKSQVSEPTVSALGYPFAVSLAQEGFAKTVKLNEKIPVRTTKRVLITDKNDGDIFFDLVRENESDLFLEPRKPQHQGKWKVYVDGKDALSKQDDESKTRILLKQWDIIVIEKGRDFRRNLVYLGAQPPILSFVQWRNGRQQRIFTEKSLAPFAYALGKTADALAQKPADQIALNIDIALHRELQQEVEKYASQNPTFHEKGVIETKILALTVMDAFKGDILAMPGWPYSNPNAPKFEEELVSTPSSLQSRLIGNPNLNNHVVGSTIKPLIFSSMAVSLWPEEDLSQLTVFNVADKTEIEKDGEKENGHFHEKVIGVLLENPWDCQSSQSPIDSRSFLVDSRDYYQGVIGMLGLLLEKSDWRNVLTPSQNRRDVIYKNRPYAIDLSKSSDYPVNLGQSEPRLTAQVPRTLLFKGLSDLFQVYATEANDTALSKSCAQFLPSISGLPLNSNTYLDNALPHTVTFKAESFQRPRNDLISFLLGAGTCQLNNVRMAEAAARLATGLRVEAKLESFSNGSDINHPEDATSERLPFPIGDLQWRNAHIISPLKQVGESGTANKLKGIVKQPFIAIYKTGTVEEVDNGPESEMLLFVIGEWRNNAFVKGKTLACFLYMQESNPQDIEQMHKFEFAKPLIEKLVSYLEKRASI